MIKSLLFLAFILFVGISCSKQEDIRGTFINDNSEEITIECDYQIISTHLSGKPFLPDNGEIVKLSTNSLKAEEIKVSYIHDSILSPFAIWDRYRDKIIIGKEIYSRKSFAECK